MAIIAGQGRQWQRAAPTREGKNPQKRKRQLGVLEHFAIVEHFLLCTKSVPIGSGHDCIIYEAHGRHQKSELDLFFAMQHYEAVSSILLQG
ncbi:MAG: hypothetical protein JF619_20945 [Massilia sp.]|nr:hypothetical protein [Massilia sp.]